MSRIVTTALIVGAVFAITVATGGVGGGFIGAATSATGNLTASLGLALGVNATAFVAGALVGAALGAITTLTAPSIGSVGSQAGSKFPVINRVDTRKAVMGTARVAGAEVFIEEYDTDGENDVPNDTLIFARIVADHVVDGFGQFYLGSEKIDFGSDGYATTPPYAGLLKLTTYDGTQTTADPDLMAASGAWSASNVGRGLAYYVVKATFDPEVFPYGAGGVRDCSIIVRGKKIYDPRKDGSQPGGAGNHRLDEPATWEYSENPALCMYDYMREDILGPSVPDAEINRAALIAAANACDELVPLKGGGTQPRYTLNGVIDSNRSKLDTLNEMITAMAGRRAYQSGQYYLFAGVPGASAMDLGEHNMRAITYNSLPADGTSANEVRGTFLSPDDNYEPIDYPAHIDASAQASEGQQVLTLNLPFTTDHRMAQRIARIELRRSRQPLFTAECMPAALQLAPWDVCTLDWPNMGLEGVEFRVTKHALTLQKGAAVIVNIAGIGHSPSIYAWDANTDEKDKVASPGLRTVTGRESYAPSGVMAEADTDTDTDGNSFAVLRVNWSPPGALASGTLIDTRRAGTAAWSQGAQALRGEVEVRVPVPIRGTFDVRVRHMLVNGTIGPAAVVSNIDVADSLAVGILAGVSAVAIAGSVNENLAADLARRGPQFRDDDVSQTTEWLLRQNLSLAALGLAVGDVISWSGYVRGVGGKQINIRCEFRASDDSLISALTTPSTTDEGYKYLEREGVTIPAGTTSLRFGYDVFPGTGQSYGQEIWLNGGARSTHPRKLAGIQTGADVTSQNTSNDTSNVGGVAAYNALRSSADLFVDDFTYNTLEEMQANWIFADTGPFQVDNDPNATGGRLVRFGNDGSADDTTLHARHSLRVERDAVYEVGFRIHVPAGGEQRAFLGVAAGNSDFSALINTTGGNSISNQHYFAMQGGTTVGGWQEYRGYFSGRAASGAGQPHTDPADPGTLYSTASRVSPIIYINYQGPGITRLDKCWIRRIGQGERQSFNALTASNRLRGSRHTPMQLLAGGGSTLSPANMLTASDVGASARINVGAYTLYYGDGQVPYSAGSMSGLAYNTNYFVYALDPEFEGGAVTYTATTTNTNAIAPGSILLGVVRTPQAGGASSTGGGGSGGGLYDDQSSL